MEVAFRTRQLQQQYEDYRVAERDYGKPVARKFIERVNIIKLARDIDQLQWLPGLRCHPLKGDRKGLWAVNLTGMVRLLFSLEGEVLQIVRIEKVSKHYDK